jgi:hypothetical protein
MNMDLKNNILFIGLIIIIIIIVYYVYNYFHTNSQSKITKQIEQFKTINNYKPVNIGDPLSNNVSDEIIKSAQNPMYNIDSEHAIITMVANISGKGLVALCSNPQQKLVICGYDLKNKMWDCIYTDSKDAGDNIAFDKINPSTTLPAMDKNSVICTKDSSTLIANNKQAIFFYNEPYNTQNNLNCLYYWSLASENNNFICLALPTINTPITTSARNNLPPLSYDKMNFICANDQVLLGISCSNILYNIKLDSNTNAPADGATWSPINISVSSIPNFNLKNITYLGMNDNAVCMYYKDYTNPAALLYSPIITSNDALTLSLAILPVNLYTPNTTGAARSGLNNISSIPNFYSRGFSLNNNILFGLEMPDSSRNINLWWCSLSPTNPPNWQRMSIGSLFNSLVAMCIYNNSLIINYRAGSANNLVIPLLADSNSSSEPTNAIATPNIALNTINNTNPAITNGNITTSNFVIPTNTKNISNNISNNISKNSSMNNSIYNSIGNDELSKSNKSNNNNNNNNNKNNKNNNINTINSNITEDTNNEYSSNSYNQNNINRNYTNDLNNLNTLTKLNNLSYSAGEEGLGADNLISGIGMAAQNGIRTDLGIQGVIGNLGNKDNINDFMKDATLLGNNIYVSPMNNDQLYNPNPQAKLSQLGKISSSFFPIIKIS